MKNGPYELIVPPEDYPGKRYRGKYAYEHRVNWWKETGENPDDFPNHVVHHRDEEKRNNRPVNLELKDRAVHTSHHARGPYAPVFLNQCPECGKDIFFTRGRPQKFCSRKCSGHNSVRKRKNYSAVS